MPRTTIGSVLLRAASSPTQVDPELPAMVAQVDPERLVAAAEHHRLAPLMDLHLSGERRVPSSLRAPFRQARLGQAMTDLRMHADLQLVSGVMERLGRPWFTMKGLVLAHQAYQPRPDVRVTGDIDVVVQATDVRDVATGLLEAGSTVVGPSWEHLRDQGVAQLGMRLPNGSVLDLHWELFSLPFAREAFPWRVEESLTTLRHVEVRGLRVPTLDHEDALLHLSVHGVLSGASRLGRLVDLVLVAGLWQDWDLLIERAHRRSIALPVSVMLERARTVLGAPVPAQALDGLLPRHGWRTVMRRAGALRPPEGTLSDHWTLEALYRASRQDVPHTLKAVARATTGLVADATGNRRLQRRVGHASEGNGSARSVATTAKAQSNEAVARLPWV